jgi:3-hydroxyacyl-CoA dehydrogenase
MAEKKIAIVGAGLIGRGWALLFAGAGYRVRVYDSNPSATDAALEAIRETAFALHASDLLSRPKDALALIEGATGLAEAVEGAFYVQEAVAESAEVKGAVFAELDRLTEETVILASSCSSIPPDEFLLTSNHPGRCIVAHPFSPPNLIPLVEIVPSSKTEQWVIDETMALMSAIGQDPVMVNKPVIGYAVNRLQAVVIAEAISLVANGVMTPEDVDKCLKSGLGRRWAFMGPFETMDLNAHQGFKDYVTKFGSIYRGLLDDIDIHTPWSEEAIDKIEAWRRQEQPDEAAIGKRRIWRDTMLAKVASLLKRG